MSRARVRSDLLDRIKDRHDLWFKDSVDLYQMAHLKTGAAVNDSIIVMSYQIVWMLDLYKIDIEVFIEGIRQTHKLFQQTEK